MVSTSHSLRMGLCKSHQLVYIRVELATEMQAAEVDCKYFGVFVVLAAEAAE